MAAGIREKNGKIQIDFYWNGKRCRETLYLEPTPKNMKYAAQLRAAILFDIKNSSFSYQKYFPKSVKQDLDISDSDITVGHVLKSQLEIYERRYNNGKLAYSTYMPYKRIIENQLLPKFSDIKLKCLTASMLRDWIMSLSISAKTYTNILIPFNSALNDAVTRGLILENPIDKSNLTQLIKQLAPSKKDEISPFTEEEREKILSCASGQVKNLIQFGFYSGLRIGELIALRWSDIDLINNIINVNRNIVHNQEKSTKTTSGVRQVLILPKAREALISQQQINSINEFVFCNPNTGKRWTRDDSIRKHWIRILADADVEYRYPYQMRHTYASILLSNGENIAWIATQMGHINTEMVIRNYGKFIPNNNLLGGYKLKGSY